MADETQVFFTLFDTAIGRCAIAWNVRGIVGLQLPERDDDAMRARLLRRHPGASEAAPPEAVVRAIEGIIAVVAGEPRDLADVVLDLSGVPELIAAQLGEPDARGVGEAMGQNPCPIIVPCHRVVAAGGKTGGFSAPGGAATKRRLLAIEGASAEAPTLFDRHGGLDFALRPGRRRAGRGLG